MDHWRSKCRGYWWLAEDCTVTMSEEADFDRVQWAMGSRVGSLFESVLVAMGVLVGVLVGIACGG